MGGRQKPRRGTFSVVLVLLNINFFKIFVAQCVEKMFSKHGALHSSQREIRLIATPSGNPEHLYRPSEAPRTTLISAEPRSPNSPNIPKLTTFTPETTPARTSRSSKAIPTIEELTKQEKKYKDNLLDTSFLDQLTFMKLATLREEVGHLICLLNLLLQYESFSIAKRIIICIW